MQEQKSQAGFDYYLGRLEQEKEKERNRATLTVLGFLARDPDRTESLAALVSQYFPYEPEENELVDFSMVLRTMVDEQLLEMHMPEEAGSDDFQKLEFSITKEGEQYIQAKGPQADS